MLTVTTDFKIRICHSVLVSDLEVFTSLKISNHLRDKKEFLASVI